MCLGPAWVISSEMLAIAAGDNPFLYSDHSLGDIIILERRELRAARKETSHAASIFAPIARKQQPLPTLAVTMEENKEEEENGSKDTKVN